MSAFDKNKIFFALVHYILSEQHNVDWILKTSLVNFTGLNTTISNKKFKQNSVTDDIIEYIYQIKPYHVQFEQFIEKHSSKDDIARIDASDTNNVEINIRFDAIQPYSDIAMTFYEYYEKNKDDERAFPKYKTHNEGTLIYMEYYNAFYEEHYDEDLEQWIWVKKDYEIFSDKYYYATLTDSLFRVVTENGVKYLKKLSDEEVFEFLNTHKANRVWYSKRNVFTDENYMKEYIIDVLNAHFKGITVDGSKFDFGNMGYEAFLYDEKLYDEPTITNDYCVVNFTEDGIHYKYKKEFVRVGIKTLLLDSEDEVLEGNCKVYREYNGETEEIHDFSISENMLQLSYPLRIYEKIKVINTVDEVDYGFIFVAHPYSETMNSDDAIIRKFVDITTDKFEIPENNIGSRKVIVYIIKSNGSKKIIKDFEEVEGYVILRNSLDENDRVQISVIDYRRIYDKIYTYEDIYGNSNNIISLDGNKFLRANYEAGRPSELAVSYPLDGSMIYKETKSGEQELYQINWKNDQGRLVLSPTMQTTIISDVYLGDKEIRVADGTRLFKPQLGRTKKIIPGMILVNSEIIEYHKLELEGKEGILTGIRRASNGSILNEFLPAGTEITAYPDQSIVNYNQRSIYISTLFEEGMENKFIIPSDFINNDKVVVYKKPYINLLTDITFNSKYFDISSDNILLPGPKKLAHIGYIEKQIGQEDKWIAYDDFKKEIGIYDNGNILNEDGEIFAYNNEYGYVFSTTELDFGQIIINDDIIYFKDISKVQGKYRIRNFNITKEYKASESIIYSNDYEKLDPSEYQVICNQKEDERVLLHVKENCVYDPDEKQVGIYLLENGTKVVYDITEKHKSDIIGKCYFEDEDEYRRRIIFDNDDETVGYIRLNEPSNIVYDTLNGEGNIIGYIDDEVHFEKSSGENYKNAYKFTGEIIGYINKDDFVVDENGNIIEYPYGIKYKDAYVILNETPRPLECIVVGNEK